MSSIKVKSDTIVNFFTGKGARYSKECTKASKKTRTCTRSQTNLNTAGLLFFPEKKVNSSKCSFVCLPTETVLSKQKIVAAMKWLLLLVALVMVLIAFAIYGHKGLMWLSDWMNEVEEQRQRGRYLRV